MSFFDDVNPSQSELAKLKTSKKTLSGKTDVKQLDSMAEEQGWIDRQPKKPGPKRREKRTVLTMNGPTRVLDEFTFRFQRNFSMARIGTVDVASWTIGQP